MNKVRYPEKKYLGEYDLSNDFFEAIEIEVNDITPLRKVFILETNDEKKMILKKIDYSEERLNFINTCIERIYDNLPNVMSLRKFKNGKRFFKWKGENYILMDLIEGREVTFTNPVEFIMSGKLLANVHKVTRREISKIISELNLTQENSLEKSLVIKFQESVNDMQEIQKFVNKIKYKNEFDEIVSDIIAGYINEMYRAVELLSFSGYSSYRDSMKNIVVCHNDLAEHNFIINNEIMYLIDFDYCTIDLRIVDLADLILKGIKNAGFDIDKALTLIDSYNSIYPLDREEYKFLYILLLYPRDIYSIIKSYYYREKKWEEEVYLSRLKAKIMNEDFRHEFLVEYKEKYKNIFY